MQHVTIFLPNRSMTIDSVQLRTGERCNSLRNDPRSFEMARMINIESTTIVAGIGKDSSR